MIRFLIDGYNFLNASGIETRDSAISGGSSLERSRLAMLDFLVEHLTPKEASETVVVFDGRYSLPPSAEEYSYHGLIIRFAALYPDADSLLEQIIQEHTSPKRLTVVSSDHRVQRAAHRRRARFIDSETWYKELCLRRAHRPQKPKQVLMDPNKENVEPSAEEVNFWLQKFTGPGQPATQDTISSAETSRPTNDEFGSGPPVNEPVIKDTTCDCEDSSGQAAILNNLQQWAERLGLSPEDLNRPIDSLEDGGPLPKKARNRRKKS
ncbi:MAG: NYN domain-containing protein [Thermogutta sp.]